MGREVYSRGSTQFGCWQNVTRQQLMTADNGCLRSFILGAARLSEAGYQGVFAVWRGKGSQSATPSSCDAFDQLLVLVMADK